jgi:Uma2 family endonuclease
LTACAREGRLGEVLPSPVDVILDRGLDLVVQPDLVFVSAARAELVGDRIHGAPDLVVEVLSPHPRVGQLHEKIEWFARYGVKECWLIDLARRQVAVLAFEDGRVGNRGLFLDADPIASGILTGLRLTPADLFGYL